ncbi:MAG: T9SS type A sorting domain-containing protein, partial [Bacteroidota bacterium]
LAVPLVRGELVYVAEDVCGQRDTFSVNHGEHLESKIFPNPTTGLCQLVLAAPPGQDQAQVRIYDTTGRLMDDLILSLEAGFVRQQLDLRHYAAGTYLVQIEGPCWQSLEKIVVMQL